MVVFGTTASVFILLAQTILPMYGMTIRQISDQNEQRTSMAAPLVSTISILPRQTTNGNLGLMPGNRVSASATAGAFGISTPTTQSNSIEGAGINVLRRGSEFVADSIVAALGGIASVINILQNYAQTGQLQFSGLGASAQALTSRLLNMGVNAASTVMQQLGDEISPSSVAFRPPEGQLFLSSNAPLTNRQLNFGGTQYPGVFEESSNFGQSVGSATAQLQSGITALRRASPRFRNFGGLFNFGADNLANAANDGLGSITFQTQSDTEATGGTSSRSDNFRGSSDFGANNFIGTVNQGTDFATTELQSGMGTTEIINAAANNLIQSMFAPFAITSADGIGPDLNDGDFESSLESSQTAAARIGDTNSPTTLETGNSNGA